MITFVAPAYKEFHQIHMFLNSLMSQTNKNWKCIVYFNGEEKMCSYFKENYKHFYHDGWVEFVSSKENTGSWGAKNRQEALINKVDTEYIINTSVQDYWVPTAVDEILKCKGSDFIYFNSLNHLFGYGQILDAQPVVTKIDWGNFAVKTEIAKQVGINHPEQFCGDGMFVEDLMKSGLIKTKYKIPLILTIHN